MGSKRRIVKEILPIILAEPRPVYIEPFAGSMAVIEKVDGSILRQANDINPYLVTMFEKLVYRGWVPPDQLGKEEYLSIKTEPEKYDPEWVAFVGFGCSFGGKWFGGYAQSKDNKGNPRNYARESKDNLLKQVTKLKGVIFCNMDYRQLNIPKDAIVYCDPPYQSTTKYKNDFNHRDFWDWARTQARKGAKVFVSEYDAPDDFRCIWEKEQTTTTCRSGYKKAIERLFTIDF